MKVIRPTFFIILLVISAIMVIYSTNSIEVFNTFDNYEHAYHILGLAYIILVGNILINIRGEEK